MAQREDDRVGGERDRACLGRDPAEIDPGIVDLPDDPFPASNDPQRVVMQRALPSQRMRRAEPVRWESSPIDFIAFPRKKLGICITERPRGSTPPGSPPSWSFQVTSCRRRTGRATSWLNFRGGCLPRRRRERRQTVRHPQEGRHSFAVSLGATSRSVVPTRPDGRH
jgi:hypothetical protein